MYLRALRQQFSLTDAEVQELAKQAVIIEKHYGRAMDIEWAKDGQDGKLYIVQARPETVRSREDSNEMERFQLQGTAPVVVEGRAIGHKIGSGKAKVLASIADMDQIQPGDVLVTDMTDPGLGTYHETCFSYCHQPWWPYLSRRYYCA